MNILVFALVLTVAVIFAIKTHRKKVEDKKYKIHRHIKK